MSSYRDACVAQVTVEAEWLSRTLSTLVRKHQVPGAQLALHVGSQTITAVAGELVYGGGRPVTPDTAFPIGSVTKACTAALAMVLVADEDLELDAEAGEYLPEITAPLTLRQLLSHTSGLASGPDSAVVASMSLRRFVSEHCRTPELVLPAGVGFSYSNLGYAVVGRIIEEVTGMTWWEAVESILCRPLGIQPQFVVGADNAVASTNLASGHAVNTMRGRTVPVSQSLAPGEAPAGALAMSALDLLRFGLLQLDPATTGLPELLPAELAEEMRRVQPGADPIGLADGWGLGFGVFRNGVSHWVGHDGNADGTDAHLRVNADSGVAIAFTSNANTGIGLWAELVDELEAAGIPVGSYRLDVPGQRTTVPPEIFGSYRNGDTEYTVTPAEDATLRLAIDGEIVARLTPHEGLMFAQQDWESGQFVHPGRFLRDPVTGELDRIQVSGRLARRAVPTGSC
ncbi:CubicO group peptidase (beta-lactamase class C family) [Crossiella equi]|uniref:CubicO group peptidase (Beta-lactamase class C family) n=1 Tax=Crossiella equi TaxID=130796 RepID=A0ABS5A9U7_9PSEU|nr:serine hydrolase domain-containing protein [Crossiella equi]MBP2473360.1 CubicO group peptidase (beta-lactamase class C family) [Crossiella equi]